MSVEWLEKAAPLVVGLSAGASAGLVPGVLAALVSRVLLAWIHQSRQERQATLSALALGRTVSALTAELSAGASLALGLSAVAEGEFAPYLRAAADDAAHGAPLSFPDSCPRALRPLEVASRLGQRTGAPMAAVLDGLAAQLAIDNRIRQAVGRALAGPRSSAALLAALPVLGIGLGQAMGARPVTLLLHTPRGLLALVLGAVLDLAGVCWTLALVRRAQP